MGRVGCLKVMVGVGTWEVMVVTVVAVVYVSVCLFLYMNVVYKNIYLDVYISVRLKPSQTYFGSLVTSVLVIH